MLEWVAGGPVTLQGKRDLTLRAPVQVLANEDDLLRRRQDTEFPASPKLEGKFTEDLVAESVERADDRVVQTDRRVDVHALLHLGGGALGESHGKNLVGLRRTGCDQVDDPRGEHMGLAGARTGDDEERSGAMLDRDALLGLQPLEDVGPWLAKAKAELLGHR